VLECTCTPIRLLGVGRGWCLGTTVLLRLGLNSFFKIILGRRDERINNTGTSLSAGQAGGGARFGPSSALSVFYTFSFSSLVLRERGGPRFGPTSAIMAPPRDGRIIAFGNTPRWRLTRSKSRCLLSDLCDPNMLSVDLSNYHHTSTTTAPPHPLPHGKNATSYTKRLVLNVKMRTHHLPSPSMS